MKKNIRYKKDVKNRTELMLFLLFTCFTLCLSVGYAALNSDLKISGEASFRVESDIRITDVSLYETTNLAVENYTSKYSKDTITIGTKLTQVNSTISYKVKVQNSGTVSMWIDSIEEDAKNNSNTEYVLEGIGLKELINSGEEKEFIVKIKYKNNITTLPDNTNLDTILKFNFVKPESILASGSDTASTSTFFNGTLKKEKIESIEFRPTLDVVDNAIGSWDASASKNGTVIASYTDTDGNGLYELYIGGIGEVNAPRYSYHLFHNFKNMTSLVFNGLLNTTNVTKMNYMISNNMSLESIDVSSFNTSNVTDMLGMFEGDEKLISLDLSSFDTKNVAGMYFMFSRCYSLKNINLTGFDTSNVTFMGYMFQNCRSLESLNLSNFNTSKTNNMKAMFGGCSNLLQLDVSSFDTSKVTDMTSMFYGCSSLTVLNVSNFNTSSITSMSNMFYNCSKLTDLDVSSFDTSNVTSMNWMFNGMSSLKSLDLSNFNTSNVTDMSGMFWNCSSLTNLDLSSFNTSHATSMQSMFQNCSKLTKIDLRNFDTSNVITMQGMFYECYSLTTLNLSSFNTSKVTNMKMMFDDCKKLTDLDLSNFNTNNVLNMNSLFMNCRLLEKLDISSFNFSNVTDSSSMFYNIPSNTLIYTKNDTSKEFILGIRNDLSNIQIKEIN